jgi:pimeloyl-ACP methyl ester carboxylesterase
VEGDSEITPFVWATSVDDEVRDSAVDGLAKLIDERSADFDRVCLVGHSHGGNVALQAAAECKSPVDTIVCLSTPHEYLYMVPFDKQDELLSLPIYCSPDTLKNTGTIVSIWPATDDVPEFWSNLRTGIAENRALQQTRDWQRRTGNPKLPSDGMLRRIGDKVNDLVGRELFQSGAIRARSTLDLPTPVGDGVINVELRTFVDNALGTRSHQTVHSRRMGFLVGTLLRHRRGPEELRYLKTFVQPADADMGRPIPAADQQRWLADNRSSFERAGWSLERVELQLHTDAKDIAREWRDSLPDPYLKVSVGNRLEWKTEKGESNTMRHDWTLQTLVCQGEDLCLEVFDFIRAYPDKSLGRFETRVSENVPENVPADVAGKRYWSAKLIWEAFHH